MIHSYQKMLDDTISRLDGKPSLLLHACCAPCSSYVLEYLKAHFTITVYYYNPNISPEAEYLKRVSELERFISEFCPNEVSVIKGEYEPEKFDEIAIGRETITEGGARCFDCYRLRLEKTAMTAKALGFDFFTTTLSVSPYKNAEKLNETGRELSEKYGVQYLFSDFKKKNGYKRSIELSHEYGLYRQDYCGCIYSKKIEL